MSWGRVSKEAVGRFLDFTGGRAEHQWQEIARRQLDGTTALYNRLSERRVAWLADEVGMGKTYVALGVIALVRHLNPAARILILVPSTRLQPKWETEIGNFTRHVVRVVDHRARTLQGTPGRTVQAPRSLHQLAVQAARGADLLAPLSAFSFGLRGEETWRAAWERLQAIAPKLPDIGPDLLRSDRKIVFKRHYAAVINTLLPHFDLVVVDESHNLKHGLHGDSARNQTLAVALGGTAREIHPELARLLRPKVGRLLCLSATPVESDYDQLVRQAELFGLRNVEGFDVLDDAAAPGRKDVAKRFVVRRLNRLAIGDRAFTKNLYRREWRWGGVDRHDDAMQVGSNLDRLVLALVQKRVTEVLHQTGGRRSDGTFLRSFQMGMLSSFESFSETVKGKVTIKTTAPEEAVEEDGVGNFDGEQTKDEAEKFGIDTHTVDALCASFRERFGRSLPHPKMDAVARAVDQWMAHGEKALVFVRRIRTVEELAGKIARAYDERLFEYLLRELPQELTASLAEAIASYRENHRRRGGGPLAASGHDDDDEGGTDTFFAWYFRGAGTDIHRVGALFRRRQLQTASSRWSILFHDNPVRRLVGPDRLQAWIQAHRETLEARARLYFPTDPRPWHNRYEAWQAAALEVLAGDPTVGAEADWLRQALYPKRQGKPVAGEIGNPEVLLAEQTLFTELAAHPLGLRIWPTGEGSREEVWREREVRRELLASAMRLGHPNIDLWLSAVQLTGRLDGAASNDLSPVELARVFLTRLDASSDASGPAGWTRRELLELGAHHDLIVSLNFPDLPQRTLPELPKTFQAVLSRQAPVLGMHGGSKSEQAIKQFRMPGYPFAIVSTDILQEGVDLHTFCARVLHYGIAHSSSASEQRTGRVDRINSLVQRRLADGLEDERMLQVHYPHLLDTVEPLQVRVLYERMDRFIRLLHEDLSRATREESRVSIDQGLREELHYPEPVKGELRSLFEVDASDLVGDDFELRGEDVPWTAGDLEQWLTRIGREVKLDIVPARTDAAFLGEAWLRDGELVRDTQGARRQPFRVALESRQDGRGLRLRVVSPIGAVDLSDGRTAGRILRLQQECYGALFDTGDDQGTLALRQDVPVEAGADVVERLRLVLEWILHCADELEQALVGEEVDATLAVHRRVLDPEGDHDAP